MLPDKKKKREDRLSTTLIGLSEKSDHRGKVQNDQVPDENTHYTPRFINE